MRPRRIELVITAAPLAERAHDIAADLVTAGWSVTATTSLNAAEWVDRDALTRVCAPKLARMAGSVRPAPPAAVVLAPATFNTLNKLRAGISDTPALGVLNDSVGQRVPLLVVPMISDRLVGHPAWIETVEWLTRVGVTMMDPKTGNLGSVEALASGTGSDISMRFDPSWISAWANSVAFALN